jgi:hypothetical protein
MQALLGLLLGMLLLAVRLLLAVPQTGQNQAAVAHRMQLAAAVAVLLGLLAAAVPGWRLAAAVRELPAVVLQTS